ncbi:MAG TPA: phosphoribosylglycinamide formyltransferase [Thermohalobaculum sp.]|nr:phosphoribosylglycinamide formyltransferase [Thermohalobaculum sp.]
MSRPAVFLDRDGTVIADPGYLGDAADLRLLPGAAAAIARLNAAGLPVIMVTNQSGIGRGYYSEDDFRAVQAELERRLAEEGARLDAVYFCPHDPTVHACECRKPSPALFERAIAEHDLDPSVSWFVGDRARDVEPARRWSGRRLLVAGPDGGFDPEATPGIPRADSLAAAVERILGAVRVVVLASGSGSNLQALIDRFADDAAVEISGVVSDRPGIGALERAAAAGIPTAVLSGAGARADELAGWLREFGADLVVLAGYLRLVPPAVVREWRGRMLNIHPSLLPAFGGEGMYGRRVHEAVLASGVSETGVTVHLVDEEYDRGPIVAQRRVPVRSGDDAERLAARVLEEEHRLLPEIVAAVARGSRRLT